MQLIEVSEIGVRASIVTMRSHASPLTWVLFPMIHLGPPTYYAEVERRLLECDLVLAEGIDSKLVMTLASSYRLAGDRFGPGAVYQSSAMGKGSPIPAVNVDLTAEEFDREWHRLPLPVRVGIPLLAPAVGLWLRYLGGSVDIQKYLQQDDLPSREQLAAEEQHRELFDLILHRRDAHLLEQIDTVQEEWCTQKRKVALAWGAAHIGVAAHHLSRTHEYYPMDAEWVTVFDYTEGMVDPDAWRREPRPDRRQSKPPNA